MPLQDYGELIKKVPLQDYGELVRTHRAAGADITIATHSVGHGQAQLRGLSRVAKTGEGLGSEPTDGVLCRGHGAGQHQLVGQLVGSPACSIPQAKETLRFMRRCFADLR